MSNVINVYEKVIRAKYRRIPNVWNLFPPKINDRSWKEKVRLLDPLLISFTVLRYSALTAILLTDLTEIGCSEV